MIQRRPHPSLVFVSAVLTLSHHPDRRLFQPPHPDYSAVHVQGRSLHSALTFPIASFLPLCPGHQPGAHGL
ncbi:hypothetical protein UCMB321_0821 [Pseudomonas batumici]|uniref:Uncharacterized protein n=1 Tax=Pseudomonas batumici TaxID=226910 RepID=A0A0C2IKD9_9PSED|nr:hypothetical protein UCMB321_0821 [Pseudomonas batumici]